MTLHNFQVLETIELLFPKNIGLFFCILFFSPSSSDPTSEKREGRKRKRVATHKRNFPLNGCLCVLQNIYTKEQGPIQDEISAFIYEEVRKKVEYERERERETANKRSLKAPDTINSSFRLNRSREEETVYFCPLQFLYRRICSQKGKIKDDELDDTRDVLLMAKRFYSFVLPI